MKPTIGMLLGDPNGVGPELAAKLLAEPDIVGRARVAVIGDLRVFRMGEAAAGLSVPLTVVDDIGKADFTAGTPVFVDFPTIEPSEVTPGRVSAAAGRSVYATLKEATRLARAGAVDGICFAPYNKQALKMGGASTGDEHVLFAEELGYDGPRCELNVLGDLWTTRVTSHVPLKEVAEKITTERVLLMTRLAGETLAAAGVAAPRIAVCALNPHAGDGGLFGREEIDVIAPAVERARAEGIAADGPFPADTIFLKARDGHYDAVVTMYHDQGQIAMKLMGFGRGVTVSGGLPVPITTPASGTAFDIVGKGIATVEGTRQAFLLVCRLAEGRAGATQNKARPNRPEERT